MKIIDNYNKGLEESAKTLFNGLDAIIIKYLTLKGLKKNKESKEVFKKEILSFILSPIILITIIIILVLIGIKFLTLGLILKIFGSIMILISIPITYNLIYFSRYLKNKINKYKKNIMI